MEAADRPQADKLDSASWARAEKHGVSRRTVAAIAFLANIRAEGEEEAQLPGYSCLLHTEVLAAHRQRAGPRCRRRPPHRKPDTARKKVSQGPAAASRERTPEVPGDSAKKTAGGSFRRRNVEAVTGAKSSIVTKARRQLSSDDAAKVMGSINANIKQTLTDEYIVLGERA